ncbi:MAG: hypothetical protein Q8907_16965 [Bacteroidota bacterium]|nr:hypothetical protein [Bacteroidota bacterium]
MKKLTVLFLFIPLFAHAQNTFKAIVKDSLTHEQLTGRIFNVALRIKI